jgi:putative MATE family efflux protein
MNKKLTLFALTWPIFIEISLHMLMGNADTLMLSTYSDDAVAAVGVANQLLSIVLVMFGFVAMGTGIVVSQYLGAKENRKAAEVAAVALGVNLLFGLLLSLVMVVFARTFLRWLGLPDELMEYGLEFLRIVGGFSFAVAVLMTASSIVRSHGFTKDVMYVTMGMNVLNVIGNYLVLFGPFGLPVLGVEGVAWSTTVARLVGIAVGFFLLRKRVGELPFAMILKMPKSIIRDILKIGLPAAGENLSYNASQVVITSFVTMMGTEALATKVYAQTVMMFVFLLSLSIGQATQILVGHQVGAGEKEEAYRTCLSSLKISLIGVMGVAVLFSLFRHQLMGFFSDNPSIVELGSTLILITLILEPGRTFNLVIISSLRAAGDVKFPVYMGILSMWGIATVLSYVLGIQFGLGLIGLWIAFSLDEWFRGLLMLWRWRTRKWEGMSLVQKREWEGESA